MDKCFILQEIKRTAAANGGVPLGTQAFYRKTELKKSDWYPMCWLRWGDALREAGFEANKFQQPIDDSILIEKLIVLTRKLGRFPVEGELRIETKRDSSFPSHSTFRRLGTRQERTKRILAYCGAHAGYEDIAALCVDTTLNAMRPSAALEETPDSYGYVYMQTNGRGEYKIGMTNSTGRRGYELNKQSPDILDLVHEIKTDDARGVERYWHERFAKKRKSGKREWFKLDAADVKAFKRWKQIY